MKKLTPEQWQLAEQYLPFTYKLIGEWFQKYKGYGYDAVHDAAITALIKSARNWDENRGLSFFSMLTLSVRNEMFKIPRFFNAHMRKGGTISLDTPLSSDDESLTIIDTLGAPDQYPVIETDYMNYIKKSLFVLTYREKKCILENYLQGKSQEEIGADIGVSQMQVSRIIKKGLIKMRGYLNEQGVKHA